MSVILVAGPSCAGKSTFIKEHFPQRTVIDLYDFQSSFACVTYAQVAQSYEQCRDALTDAIKRGEQVVLEHTLLKAKRRPMYIDAIRSVTDEPIEIYFLLPSAKQLLVQMHEREYKQSLQDAQDMISLAEPPTLSEGFDAVHIISDDSAIARDDYIERTCDDELH